MELYSSILKLAPLILLKLVAGGVLGAARPERAHQRLALAFVLVMTASILAGAFVAVLVTGNVIDPTSLTRWTVVLAGCVSLVMLAAHMLLEVTDLYATHRSAKGQS